MEIHLLGAAGTVTGSQFVLTTERARVVVDCGMFQGNPHEAIRNRVPIAYDTATVDAILLTHAHLDHCGLIPHVVKEGYKGPIYATSGTMQLAEIVLLDSGKLQEDYTKRHYHWASKHPDRAAAEDEREIEEIEQQVDEAERVDEAGITPRHVGDQLPDGHVVASGLDELSLRDEQGLATRLGFPPVGHPEHSAALQGAPMRPNVMIDEPLYTAADAKAAMEQFRPVEYEKTIDVAPGITAVFHDAGHILGSSIVELHVEPQNGIPARTFVFSGDLGRTGAPILRDPTVVRSADYVFVESTYGGREHEPQEDALKALEQAVNDVVAQKGVLLIPAFAIGRTQEVAWALRQLLETGRIPKIRLFLDSPMASKASAVYREHVDYYDTAALEDVHEGEGPFEYPDEKETKLPAQSELIAQAHRPYVVVASNGMLTGGRVLNHLHDLIGDTKALILLVGYQGDGTLGARLLDGAKTARVDGQEFAVRCAVRSIGGFSAHADEPQLLAWLRNFTDGRRPGDPGFPRRVFIVHGDPEAQQAFEPKVQQLGLPTLVPQWHQHLTLD